MSEADGQQEPSMEEILASIRRIISEDGEGEEGAQAAPAPAQQPAEPMPEPEPEPEVAAMPEPAPIPAEPEDDDVLELTDVVEDDGTVVDLAHDPEPDFEPDPIPSDPMLPPDAGEPFEDELVEESESLISDHAAAAAAGSLAVLSTAAGRKIADQLGASDIGGVTVEELVRQLLRPMLRDWLDENLPSMVERLVRREIERLAAQGGGR